MPRHWFSDYLLANAGAQKFALENKNIADKLGASVPYLPPGSTVTLNQSSGAGKLAGLALATALGASGLGIAQYAGLLANRPAPTPTAPQQVDTPPQQNQPVVVEDDRPYVVRDENGRELWRGKLSPGGRQTISLDEPGNE